jgi:hypothetical protein
MYSLQRELHDNHDKRPTLVQPQHALDRHTDKDSSTRPAATTRRQRVSCVGVVRVTAGRYYLENGEWRMSMVGSLRKAFTVYM